MGKICLWSLVLGTLMIFFGFSRLVLAKDTHQLPKEEFHKAKVVEIVEEGSREISGYENRYVVMRIEMLDGDEEGKVVEIEQIGLGASQKFKAGSTIVVAVSTQEDGERSYQVIDKYRLDRVIDIALIFAILVLVISRWKGLGSLVGLGVSAGVIVMFVVPQILAGRDPLMISIAGSLVIMLTTLYLAHGFSRKTTIALISTFACLSLTGILSVVFVWLTQLSGLGSEDAYALTFGETNTINFKGLLLGGMIIGTLGVLDDVTTSQTAAVFELADVNRNLSVKQLLLRGLNIGREHISSLTNTLVLAYAGAALPIFIWFVLRPNNEPAWVLMNSEFIAEEIVRTLAGSMGLVLAVPITTALAAWYVKSKHR